MNNLLPKIVWGLFQYSSPGTGRLVGLYYTEKSAHKDFEKYSSDINIEGYFNIHELEIEE